MKKHEACYFLNEIIRSNREDIKRYEARLNDLPGSLKHRDQNPTEEKLAEERKWITEALTNLKNKEEALDIAASSLTKEPPNRSPFSMRIAKPRPDDVSREAVIATGGVE